MKQRSMNVSRTLDKRLRFFAMAMLILLAATIWPCGNVNAQTTAESEESALRSLDVGNLPPHEVAETLTWLIPVTRYVPNESSGRIFFHATPAVTAEVEKIVSEIIQRAKDRDEKLGASKTASLGESLHQHALELAVPPGRNLSLAQLREFVVKDFRNRIKHQREQIALQRKRLDLLEQQLNQREKTAEQIIENRVTELKQNP